MSFFCLLDILIGRLDDCEQFRFCISDCLFFELLNPALLIFVALLSFNAQVGLLPRLHLLSVVLLSFFISFFAFFDFLCDCLDLAYPLSFFLDQLLDLLGDVASLQLIVVLQHFELVLMLFLDPIFEFAMTFSFLSYFFLDDVLFLGYF